MPFGPYDSWTDCIRQNQQADDPDAYCATIKRAIEGSELTRVSLGEGRALLTNMEIFATGYHEPQVGPARHWDENDLKDLVAAYRENVLQDDVFLGPGHTSEEFCRRVAEKLGVPVEVVRGEGSDGAAQISLGRMTDMRYRSDGVLVADFATNDKVADLIAEEYYTAVSPEMYVGYGGHPFVIESVRLLGVEHGAVKEQAGLEDMATLVAARRPQLAPMLRMKGGHLQFRDLNLEELEEVNAAMQAVIKGKKSEGLLQQMWEQVKSKWEALLGKPAGGAPGPAMKEDDVDLKALAAKLGMAEKEEYQEEEVLSRLDQVMGMLQAVAEALGLAPPSPEQPPEEVAAKAREIAARAKEVEELKMGGRQAAAQYAERLQAAEGQIVALQRDKRIAAFRESVRTLTAVEGEPDALASELLEIEDKMGSEAMQRQLGRWRATQQYAERAQVMTRVGTSRPGEGAHPLEAEIKQWMEENEKDLPEAYVHFREAKPQEFRDYHRSVRNGE